MIIIIKKDGQIVTDDGNPIEGKALEGAYMLLADAQDGDSIVYDGTNHMWKAGSGGGSFAPDITDPQDGDTLVYNAAQQKWVNGAGGSGGDNFVVTFTVSEDNEWVCDKTIQEICEAEETGKIIYFNIDSQYYSKLYTTTYLLASYDDGGTTKYAVEVFFIFVDENDDYKTKLLEVTYTVNGINVADRPLGA